MHTVGNIVYQTVCKISKPHENDKGESSCEECVKIRKHDHVFPVDRVVVVVVGVVVIQFFMLIQRGKPISRVYIMLCSFAVNNVHHVLHNYINCYAAC